MFRALSRPLQLFKKKMAWLVISLTVIFGSFITVATVGFVHILDGPVLETTHGKIQGIEATSRQGRIFFKYQGIPYAQAPLSELRFEPPQPPLKWEGIRDGSQEGSECLQVELLFGTILGHEDCLFLNIYTPKLPSCAPTSPNSTCDDMDLLPVMVFIHGGFLHNGGSKLYQPNYFMDEDVVLVTLNYRLAALGFLSTGDNVIRGNMGLKDQSMALKWINQNIRVFGGDPDRVTLFGESCGGMAVHYHMFSPLSKGLVSRFISQSGIALHFWTLKKEPKRQSIRFGKLLGCPTNDTKQMVRCLKNVKSTAIVHIYKEILDPLRDHVTLYKPVVEDVDDGNAFITKTPQEILESGNYTRLPWISGFNSEEGLFLAATIMANKTLRDLAQNDWNEFAHKMLVYEKNDNASQKILDYYFSNKSDLTSHENMDTYARMVGDRVFYREIHQAILLQSKMSPVYAYEYAYRGKWTTTNLFKGMHGKFPRWFEAGWSVLVSGNSQIHDWINRKVGRTTGSNGTSHSDELALQFKMPWVSDVYKNSTDYPMSVDLVKLWVEFAKQTNETEIDFKGIPWCPVKAFNDSATYLLINEQPKLINISLTRSIKFWDSLNLTEAT